MTRRYRYRLTSIWGDLRPELVQQLNDAEYIVDRWKGREAEWSIFDRKEYRVIGGFTGELAGMVFRREVPT
jgi:hypothetical protein